MLPQIGLVFLLVGISLQQKDPLKDFCRRFGSQSAIVDDKLYLDGGLVNWTPLADNPKNVTNKWLFWHDLTQSPDLIGVAPLHANLSKNATIPDVTGGSLWADEVNKRLYLYGGEYVDATPNQPEVLSYDIINDEWQSEGRMEYAIGSVAWGASASISDLGQSYVLGGWMSNATMPGFVGPPIATSYLLQYDMVSGDWQNRTGPNNVPKAEGSMHYLPIGMAGGLVYFGGGVVNSTSNAFEELPMSTIYLYDIKSSQWYEQIATGDIPASRRRFCAGAAWTEDRTSYNIYLYGGLGFGSNYTGFDDVYILSMPSFKWVKYWEGDYNHLKSHHSLTCNVVGGQMVIIGGSFPLTDACDSPSTWGVHNLDLGEVTGYPWVEYRLNLTEYFVPPAVVSVIGGSPTGAATVKSPALGYVHYDLDIYFRQRAAVASRQPTRVLPSATSLPSTSSTGVPSSGPRLQPGAIAGVAIGGALFLLGIFALAFCLLRRVRKKQDPSSLPYSHLQQARQVPHSTYPPTSPFPHTPQFSVPAPSYQLQAEPAPVELSTSRSREHIHTYDRKDRFSFEGISSHEDGISPQSPVGSTNLTVGPAISPHRESFPTSDDGSTASTTVIGPRGGSIGTISSLGRPELVGPQLTISSIEWSMRDRTKGFQNQTYYSP